METTRYDPAVIQEFADGLYAEAARIVYVSTFLGLLIGFWGGYLVGGTASTKMIYAVIGGGILGVLGHAIGTSRAFRLKLQAQIALCQVKIEQNTRTTSAIPNE